MPAKSGQRQRHRHSPGPLLATSLDRPADPPSDEDAHGRPHEHALDGGGFESDHMPDDEAREAVTREAAQEAVTREVASSPRLLAPADVAHLHATIEMLSGQLAAARFESRGPDTAHRLLTWKHGSMRSLPADTSPLDKPGAILPFRREVFDWLGAYSFVLRLSVEERKLMSGRTELDFHRANRKAFQDAWTPNSLTHLQHDIYMELKRHLSGFILVSHLFSQVTTEYVDCAERFWDALLTAFHPRSPQVVAAVIAEATVTILKGPDHDTTDPAKAFRKWDAAVSSLNQNASDLPPLDAKTLSACLMVASLHASKEDSYYQAYTQLQAALALPSATFDGPTVRAAAVAAFHAEQRRRSSNSRAPDAVMAFAASTGFRRPTTGTSTPASSCCRCPHHCVLPDGTFRVVRPVEAHLSAASDRDPFADVSDKTIKAYQAYKAAIEDPHCSRADLARLTGNLKSERQSDRERARYYRMQEEEAAVLAAAAAGDYDSDD